MCAQSIKNVPAQGVGASIPKRQLPYVCDDCKEVVHAIISNVVKLDVQVVSTTEQVCEGCLKERIEKVL